MMAKTMAVTMIMGLDEPEIRSDAEGDGTYGAKRGSRKHAGVDLCCEKGAQILSPVHGRVTKIGYPYGSGKGGANDSSGHETYRYVQITTDPGTPERKHHRIFYVSPMVKVGQTVRIGAQIAVAQDVSERYDTDEKESVMMPHVHYEIMDKAKKFEDPTKFKFQARQSEPAPVARRPVS